MTADDYPTVAAIDAHIATEQHQLQLYRRRIANLSGTAKEVREAANELFGYIEVTLIEIDELLDIRLVKVAANTVPA